MGSLGRALLLASLSSSFGALSQESPRVLPRGIHALRSVSVQSAPIVQSYGSSLDRQNVFEALNLRIGAADLGEPVGTLYRALNDFEAELGQNLLQYSYSPTGEVVSTRQVFAFERGLTSRLSVGLALTYIQNSTRFVMRGVRQDQIRETSLRVQGTLLESKLTELQSKLPSADQVLNAALESRGYILPRETQSEGWSDLDLGLKYLLVEGSTWKSSLLFGVRAPTATHQADPRNPLDRSSGDKQWDLSVQGVQGLRVLSNFSLHLSTRLTWQLPDEQRIALASRGDPLPANLLDPQALTRVRRDLGDSMEAEVSAVPSFFSGQLTPYGAYQYAYRMADSHTASTDRDLERLSKNTQSQSHRLELGVSYSTVPMVLKDEFSLPLELKVAWNHSLAGQNAPLVHYGRIDFAVFF
jgi:hypothetical protein